MAPDTVPDEVGYIVKWVSKDKLEVHRQGHVVADVQVVGDKFVFDFGEWDWGQEFKRWFQDRHSIFKAASEIVTV